MRYFNSPLAPLSLLLRPGGFGGRGPGAEEQVVEEGEVEEAGCRDDEPVFRSAGEGGATDGVDLRAVGREGGQAGKVVVGLRVVAGADVQVLGEGLWRWVVYVRV